MGSINEIQSLSSIARDVVKAEDMVNYMVEEGVAGVSLSELAPAWEPLFAEFCSVQIAKLMRKFGSLLKANELS